MKTIYNQAEINSLILDKLKLFSNDIYVLSVKAIQLSLEMTENDVVEVLKSEIKDIVNEKAGV